MKKRENLFYVITTLIVYDIYLFVFYLVCVCVYVFLKLCAPNVYRLLWRPEEGVSFSGTRVQVIVCSCLCGPSEQNL